MKSTYALADSRELNAKLSKPLVKSSKDIINDHSDLPEFNLLKAYRSYSSAIVQLSKVMISAEINDGRCKTEYQPLSGTGRMSCGNNKGLGTPNLQAFVKKAEGRYFGFSTDSIKRTLINWWLPSVEESVKIRKLFELSNKDYAFITEDANASHARLAIGFGQCEFGKQSQIGGINSHSMFAMMALKAQGKRKKNDDMMCYYVTQVASYCCGRSRFGHLNNQMPSSQKIRKGIY